MATPEFDRNKKKLLFFCRGRGSGHAIPDIEITNELLTLLPDVDVRFVSYSTGARTLAEHGFTVIDLDLPDLNSLLDVMVLATKVIGWLEPDVIVSHEEFGALPAAQVYDRPSIFITDWFVREDRIIMSALRYAGQILFTDWEGRYEEPPQAKGKVTYVGPVVRKFQYSAADRLHARRELGLTEEGVVISVLPGNYATEARAPIADLVLDAFDRLRGPRNQLVWVAGDDAAALTERVQGRKDILILEREWQIDRVMAASDAAITKANRKTVIELEVLGIPSIALSAGLNPIDDARAEASPSTTFRRLGETRPEMLAADLQDAILRGVSPGMTFDDCRPAAAAAQKIAAVLRSA